MAKTYIVSFEGGEAVGKSTQVKKFLEYLNKNGIKNLYFREPGGTEMGEKIRAITIDKAYSVDTTTEALLMNAMRSKLCHEKLLPLIEKDEEVVVVLDRFYHSSIAYQVYAGGADMKMVKNLIKYATRGIKPNLTIYLSQPAEISYQRKIEEGKQDRLESNGLDYYKKVALGFDKQAKKDKRIKTINANQPVEKVHQDIIDVFNKNYKK